MVASPSQSFHLLSRAWSRLCGIRKFMVLRCTDPRQRSYPAYGGRGISVCREWSESPDEFFDWAMTNGYGDDLSIDRINRDGNYEPQNCRWATLSQQQANARKPKVARLCTSLFRGVSIDRRGDGRIYAQINVSGKLIRLGKFATEEAAARAYDAAALKHFGEFARLNFPQEAVA